jgi:hypothetical protein
LYLCPPNELVPSSVLTTTMCACLTFHACYTFSSSTLLSFIALILISADTNVCWPITVAMQY